MSRPRKPVETATGHRTKAEIKQRKEFSVNVIPNKSEIQPPDWLKDKKMVDEFYKIAYRLLDIGIFTDLDCDTLARYLIAKQNWLAAERDVIEANKLADRKEFQSAIKALNVVTMECQKLAAALGMTIQARCNMSLPPKKEEKVNKFDEFV